MRRLICRLLSNVIFRLTRTLNRLQASDKKPAKRLEIWETASGEKIVVAKTHCDTVDGFKLSQNRRGEVKITDDENTYTVLCYSTVKLSKARLTRKTGSIDENTLKTIVIQYCSELIGTEPKEIIRYTRGKAKPKDIKPFIDLTYIS